MKKAKQKPTHRRRRRKKKKMQSWYCVSVCEWVSVWHWQKKWKFKVETPKMHINKYIFNKHNHNYKHKCVSMSISSQRSMLNKWIKPWMKTWQYEYTTHNHIVPHVSSSSCSSSSTNNKHTLKYWTNKTNEIEGEKKCIWLFIVNEMNGMEERDKNLFRVVKQTEAKKRKEQENVKHLMCIYIYRIQWCKPA